VASSMKRSSAAGLLAALLLGGCSSGQAGEPLDVDALAQNTTDFQSSILQDGTVDADEYERAVLAAHACVVEKGFEPDAPDWYRGELTFSVEMMAKDEAALAELNGRYDVAYEDCMAEYAYDVADVWVNQLLLTSDERDSERPDVINCLRAAGLEVSDDASDADIYAAMTLDTIETWQGCNEQYPKFFLVPPSDE
jgi:hypothetical protein